MIDYLVIGCGLAGVSLIELLQQNGKTVHVFDNASQPSSTVAGGMYNPVVLKRFTEIWKASEQVDIVTNFYPNLEKKLNVKFDFSMSLYRKFASIEEQNNWFVACDKVSLAPFLNQKIVNSKFNHIDSPFGYGEVFNSGYLDIKKLISNFQKMLQQKNLFFSDEFKYNDLIIEDNSVSYNGIRYKKVVFAEGFGLHANPYFNDLPLDGTKGELIHIKAIGLEINSIIKSNIFILPIGNHIYKVGATYNWQDKTNEPTAEGKSELIEKLNELISCDYEVIEHLAGVRPTVKDRRPLVGTHYVHKNLHILNGLGTRGVMLGPFLAKSLYDYLELDAPLDKEIDINRFYKKRAN